MNNIFGILLILFFALLEFSAVKRYFDSKSWQPEYCDYGTIIDKYIKYDEKDNDKDYYIIVNANQNNLKYKIKFNEYQTLEIDDEIVIFAIENEDETCMSKKVLNGENTYAPKSNNILDSRIPNENDLQNFENWKKRQRNSLVFLCIFFLIFALMFIALALNVMNLEVLVFGLIFGFADFILIKRYFDINKWEMEYCNYGIVVDKKIVHKNRHRKYLITVESNENTIRENAKSEYRIVNIGDEVIVFTIYGKQRVYIAKKD